MSFWIWVALSLYWLGFVVTVLLNPWWASPITTGLSLRRALVWPVWSLTGWPYQYPIRLPPKRKRR